MNDFDLVDWRRDGFSPIHRPGPTANYGSTTFGYLANAKYLHFKVIFRRYGSPIPQLTRVLLFGGNVFLPVVLRPG